jgi:hypothetical protein
VQVVPALFVQGAPGVVIAVLVVDEEPGQDAAVVGPPSSIWSRFRSIQQ